MPTYTASFRKSAAKQVADLDEQTRRRVLSAIADIEREPRANGVEKLTGVEGYRLRVGTYRIVFTIDDEGKTVVVERVLHRREVYR